jgi:hypothetical protein
VLPEEGGKEVDQVVQGYECRGGGGLEAQLLGVSDHDVYRDAQELDCCRVAVEELCALHL